MYYSTYQFAQDGASIETLTHYSLKTLALNSRMEGEMENLTYSSPLWMFHSRCFILAIQKELVVHFLGAMWPVKHFTASESAPQVTPFLCCCFNQRMRNFVHIIILDQCACLQTFVPAIGEPPCMPSTVFWGTRWGLYIWSKIRLGFTISLPDLLTRTWEKAS